MNKPQGRIYLSPPHLGEEEGRLLQDAVASNWIAPLGPYVDAFEQALTEYSGAGGVAAVSSGTAAIHLALKLLEVKPGDTVFCSTLTFAASANPILYEQAIPVFIDSEPDTWNMSPAALERALRDAKSRHCLPKAIIVVNLYGQCARYDAIRSLCDAYRVPIIEDAAESLGADYQGAKSGTLGEFGIYSFNGNKIITTSGGGALVARDKGLLERAKHLASQARDPAIHYQHSKLGYNYRLSNLLAALGLGQLRQLDGRVQARREVFRRYAEALSDLEGIQFMPEMPEGRSTRWLTAMTLDPDRIAVSIHELVNRLAEANIEARPVWKPLHVQPLYQGCDYYTHGEESCSDQLFSQGICLPSGSSLSIEEQEYIIALVRQVLQDKRR